MAHWAATNKKDGRVIFVTDKNYDPADWDLVSVNREPTEFDDFDGQKLVKNVERETKAKKREWANTLTREELLDILELLDMRLSIVEESLAG